MDVLEGCLAPFSLIYRLMRIMYIFLISLYLTFVNYMYVTVETENNDRLD